MAAAPVWALICCFMKILCLCYGCQTLSPWLRRPRPVSMLSGLQPCPTTPRAHANPANKQERHLLLRGAWCLPGVCTLKTNRVGLLVVPWARPWPQDVLETRGAVFVPESISSAGAVLADSIERFDRAAYRTARPAYVYAYIHSSVKNKTRQLLSLARAANMVGVSRSCVCTWERAWKHVWFVGAWVFCGVCVDQSVQECVFLHTLINRTKCAWLSEQILGC